MLGIRALHRRPHIACPPSRSAPGRRGWIAPARTKRRKTRPAVWVTTPTAAGRQCSSVAIVLGIVNPRQLSVNASSSSSGSPSFTMSRKLDQVGESQCLERDYR